MRILAISAVIMLVLAIFVGSCLAGEPIDWDNWREPDQQVFQRELDQCRAEGGTPHVSGDTFFCNYQTSPTVTTSGSGSTGTSTSEVSGKQLGSGESWTVPAGFTCSGDLVVEGTVLYDEVESTGMVVFFEQAAKVEAPWGASCVRGNRVNIFAQLARRNGCVNGCSEGVTKYTWP